MKYVLGASGVGSCRESQSWSFRCPGTLARIPTLLSGDLGVPNLTTALTTPLWCLGPKTLLNRFFV